jgi:CBS-domain-containing membrane protein
MLCVRWMRSLVGQPVFAMAGSRRIPCVVGGVAMIVALDTASFALAPPAGAAALSRQPNFGANV